MWFYTTTVIFHERFKMIWSLSHICLPTRKYPFIVISQFFLSKNLIILPIENYHRLAQDTGDPKVPVTALQMTARCGSTLLCQMLNKVAGIRVMAEPWALVAVNYLYQSCQINDEELSLLIQSTIRLQCKLEPSDTEKVKGIIWKMSGCNMAQSKIIADHFPSINQLFVVRQPKACMSSLIKLIEVEMDRLYFHLPWGHRFLLQLFPFPYDMDVPRKFMEYRRKVMMWPFKTFLGT